MTTDHPTASSRSHPGVLTVKDAGTRTMRRLASGIVECLQPLSADDDLTPALGDALSRMRGRPVRLRQVVFPPETASGLWVDAPDFDLIAYEQNTAPVHQRVIIGHETWHMFAGHCGSQMLHGAAAARAQGSNPAGLLKDLVGHIIKLDHDEVPSMERMDASLHIAALRAESPVCEESEAEMFGFRFATALQAFLAESRATADPEGIAGRIQVSMAHRRHRARRIVGTRSESPT
ncbi:toxin-antitoxin system, toxin component [Streptomyces sp. ID05-47C]|uniref:toxin-antitoxin system, toxin component n=1 Tax=Streptomyces sp. ID05-47C TaxID=3028665 RepID=UPI0029B369B9|nr:toxin-antitoxin system, toxin component [Streptomyces sp. ID05-47C]MDX3572275.1 toxin-antitoxin system, toxin component [Streptomyces sp. ID05-47C]